MDYFEIGKGYSSDRQVQTGNVCIDLANAKLYTVGTPESITTFNGLSSYTETAKELHVGLDASIRINLGLFSLEEDDSISYVQYLKETDYSKSYIFKITTKLPSVRLNIARFGQSNLSPEYQKLYQTSPRDFLKQCGDFFVYEESLGGSIYLNVKLDFVTKTEKDSFTVNAGFLLGGILAFFSLAGSSLNNYVYSQRATLSIGMLQKGGNLDKLQKRVPELSISSGGMSNVDCLSKSGNGQDVGKAIAYCEDIMNRALDYAITDFPKSFGPNYEFATVISTLTKNYSDIGINPGFYNIPQKVLSIRTHLKNIHDAYTHEITFLNKLTSSPAYKYLNISTEDEVTVSTGWAAGYITQNAMLDIKKLNQTLTNYIYKIIALSDVCYDQVNNCRDFEVSVDDKIYYSFQQAFVIKSSCQGNIYGPRYLLPKGEDENSQGLMLYIEDSIIFVQDKTLSIRANYSIEFVNNSNSQYLDLEVNLLRNQGEPKITCATLQRDHTYQQIIAYNGPFDRYEDCATAVCPMGETDANVELIISATPI